MVRMSQMDLYMLLSVFCISYPHCCYKTSFVFHILTVACFVFYIVMFRELIFFWWLTMRYSYLHLEIFQTQNPIQLLAQPFFKRKIRSNNKHPHPEHKPKKKYFEQI